MSRQKLYLFFPIASDSVCGIVFSRRSVQEDGSKGCFRKPNENTTDRWNPLRRSTPRPTPHPNGSETVVFLYNSRQRGTAEWRQKMRGEKWVRDCNRGWTPMDTDSGNW